MSQLTKFALFATICLVTSYLVFLPIFASEPVQLSTYLQADRVFFLLFGWAVLVVTFAQQMEDESDSGTKSD